MKKSPGPSRAAASFLALVAGLLLGFAALQAAAGSEQAPAEYVVVRHVLYMAEDGTVAVEEESRGTASAAYVVNDHLWGTNSIPVPVYYNPEGAPEGLDAAPIIQEAMNTWNAAGANFAFTFAGEGSGSTGTCLQSLQVDGVNTIKFSPLDNLVLGITCTVYPPGGKTKLAEFDMELSPAINWSTTLPVAYGSFDIATTILHELGHAAGIKHNCGAEVGISCSSKHFPAVMYPRLQTEMTKRVLTQDDLDAIRGAYGASGVTPSPTVPPPTATPTPTPIVTVPPSAPVLERARAPLLARD